ncbi:YpoC family protein [Bacillus andreraoultii]|uniref:YpoC family protein n=1 Tax=Bacillus andreraoultii TaxID=1499685 RepID=UPI00067F2AFC|nr:hypothetical protein [Bacillus andreraoultii]
MKVSEPLNHRFFYEGKMTPSDFFVDENKYYLGDLGDTPWLMGESEIKKILSEWNELRIKLLKLFKERQNKETRLFMVKGISLFLKLLFWTNERPVVLTRLEEELNRLKVKPVNIEDRMQFLMNRPTLHHAFIQLSELIVETEKMFYKNLVIKKRVSHKMVPMSRTQ